MNNSNHILKEIKVICIILTTLLINSAAYTQPEIYNPSLLLDDDNRAKSFFLLPETGFWFGTYTNIELAPQLGYYVTDRWSLGAGPHYSFYNSKLNLTTRSSTHIFGIKTFSRFSLIRNAEDILPIYLFDELFAHVEYEKMNLSATYFNLPSTNNDRIWIDYFYFGAGLSQKIGPKSGYFIMLLWNLNESYFSLYNNPSFRVGITISFK